MARDAWRLTPDGGCRHYTCVVGADRRGAGGRQNKSLPSSPTCQPLSLAWPGHLHAAVQRHRHIAVAGADGQAQLFKLLGFWFMAQQGADDVQRFPRMGVVVLGMLAQPAGGFFAVGFREGLCVGVGRAHQIGPIPSGAFDGVVGGGHRYGQRFSLTGAPAPVRQRQRRRVVQAGNQRVAGDIAGFGPIHPVIGVVLFHAQVADQPGAGQVFARVAAIAHLQQVEGHVLRKLFNHRPHANQEVTHDRVGQGGVAHALEQHMLGDAGTVGGAVFHQLASPVRVAGEFHQRAGAREGSVHEAGLLYQGEVVVLSGAAIWAGTGRGS